MAYFKKATYLLLKNYTLYYTHQNWQKEIIWVFNTSNPCLSPNSKFLDFIIFSSFSWNPNKTKEYVYGEREREIVTKAEGIYIIASIYTRPSRNLSKKKKNTHLSKLNTEKSLKNPQIKCLRYNNFNMYLIKWLMANTQ